MSRLGKSTEERSRSVVPNVGTMEERSLGGKRQ